MTCTETTWPQRRPRRMGGLLLLLLSGCAASDGGAGTGLQPGTYCQAAPVAVSATLAASRLRMSPEEQAAADGDLAAVRRWRSSGQPEPVGDSGTTLLQWAALGGQMPVAAFLLDSGADPNARDSFGDTALHAATVGCRTDVMRLLLQRGADPELRNRRGDRAVDMARRAGAQELVRVLQR